MAADNVFVPRYPRHPHTEAERPTARSRTGLDADLSFHAPSDAASLSDGGSARPVLRAPGRTKADHRLRKHAEYQRVYREGRKSSSASMSYFFAPRPAASVLPAGARVGLTAGRILGKAVDRNRIKRRMREIVRRQIGTVRANVDIVLHPRKSVLSLEFAKLEREVARIFSSVQAAAEGAARLKAEP